MGVKIKATGDVKFKESRLLDKEAVTITICSGISPPSMEDKKMPLHFKNVFHLISH